MRNCLWTLREKQVEDSRLLEMNSLFVVFENDDISRSKRYNWYWKQPIVLVSIVNVFRLRGAVTFRGDLAMKRERLSRRRLGWNCKHVKQSWPWVVAQYSLWDKTNSGMPHLIKVWKKTIWFITSEGSNNIYELRITCRES